MLKWGGKKGILIDGNLVIKPHLTSSIRIYSIVPNSGQLSLQGIKRELETNNYGASNTYTNISLTDLSDGTVDSINTANDSGDRPDESAPHGMEEFYNYDHDKSGAQVPTNLAAYTTNETIAYVSFDTQAGTTRVYMYLNYDGITGSGTGYAGTQIVLGSSGYLDTSAGASTYSIIFGTGNTITLAGGNLNVMAANDFLQFTLKGGEESGALSSATDSFRIATKPETPTSLSSDRIENTQFTASFDDPHGTNPAGKYLLWFGDSTTRTSNTQYEVTAASSAGGSKEWYSADEETLDANSNYYWWVASSGSYGNGVSDYSARQDITTKNVTFGTPTSEDLSQVAGGSAVFSNARSFDVTNIPTSGHVGNFEVDITSIGVGTGVLEIAISRQGDPGKPNGTDNSGTGWLTENTVNAEYVLVGSGMDIDNDGTQTIYYRLKYTPHAASHAQDDRTITFSCNGASATATIGVTSTKSDRRLKTNINLVGHSKHLQIPIYTFNYKEDLNTIYKGVMAQDLLKMNFNHAVITDPDGYYGVLYDLIDVDMETLN